MNAMRIIAALLVVLSHMRPLFFVDYTSATNQDATTAVAYALTTLGHQAVIVFFVLSGYWVGGSALQGFRTGRFDTVAYSVARVARLWIVLLPTIILTQVLDRTGTALWPTSDIYAASTAYHTLLPVDGAIHHLDVLTTLANMFFVMGLHGTAIGTNGPLWSLAAEFWYYLLFPAILFLIWRGVSLRARIIAGVVVTASGAILILPTQPGSTNVLGLFPTWLAGVGVAAAREPIISVLRRMRAGSLAFIRGTLLALVIVAAIVDNRLQSSLPTVYVLATLTALLVASLITDVQSQPGRAILAPLSWAAEWSYSLYAIHVPVLAILAAAFVPLASERWQLTPATAGRGLLITALPILFAIAFYFPFERNTKAVAGIVKRRIPLRATNLR